ncbi:hypothetical protein GNZ12_12290 [Paraburkholderia sp. 1N]|uniref:Uncharacterized protein n=2 Tax=Paraburkholderia solitsugae TaxID=2675748 RepID=A0ABX2BMB4_9BURK|nr:hypothetical protein [Paraburkholderia solitsugae]
MIEIVWRHLKYQWQRFITEDTIGTGFADLRTGYGTKFRINLKRLSLENIAQVSGGRPRG